MVQHDMGWIPVEGSGKSPLVEGTIPVSTLAAEAAEPHWLLTLLVALILIGIGGALLVEASLVTANVSPDSGDYMACWLCYCCCCCFTIFFVWAGAAIVYVASVPVDDNYTPEDAQADGGDNGDT